jgi:hypothetical protein
MASGFSFLYGHLVRWYCLRHGLLGSREVRLAFLCAFRNWNVDLRRSFFLEMMLISHGRAVLGAIESSKWMGAAVWEAVVRNVRDSSVTGIVAQSRTRAPVCCGSFGDLASKIG